MGEFVTVISTVSSKSLQKIEKRARIKIIIYWSDWYFLKILIHTDGILL